jgi:hypothetical protein
MIKVHVQKEKNETRNKQRDAENVQQQGVMNFYGTYDK